MNKDFCLSPSQGLQILAVAEMLREGTLHLTGESAYLALVALTDAAQEIALQVPASFLGERTPLGR